MRNAYEILIGKSYARCYVEDLGDNINIKIEIKVDVRMCIGCSWLMIGSGCHLVNIVWIFRFSKRRLISSLAERLSVYNAGRPLELVTDKYQVMGCGSSQSMFENFSIEYKTNRF
jgi:hypothetical protein